MRAVRWKVQIFCDTLGWKSVLISCDHWGLIVKPYWSVPRSRTVKWFSSAYNIIPHHTSIQSPRPPYHLTIAKGKFSLKQNSCPSDNLLSSSDDFWDILLPDHLKDGIYDRVIIMEQSLSCSRNLLNSCEAESRAAGHVYILAFHSLPCGNNLVQTSSDTTFKQISHPSTLSSIWFNPI